MDLSWLLWLFLLLVVPILILEMSSTLKFHCKIAFYCLHCLLLSALAVPVCLIKSGGRNVDNMRIIRAFVRSMKYVYGLRYEVKGLENFQIKGPCVIISNHQSVLDMMGMMEILPDRCVAIAKKELIFAGSVGAITYLGGIIYINRKRTSDAKGVMDEVGNVMMSDNLKVWIYPEGTRNISDDLLPFKKGAFHLAVKAQVPIVQVVYSSYSSFYNQSKSLFTSGTIKVEIFPKIETTGLTAENVTELTEKCYSTMRETFFRLSNKVNKVNGPEHSLH